MRSFISIPLAASLFTSLTEAYTFKNVRIGGGGGFTPGIVFNTKTKGVAYARTDIGGLYKLNDDDSWTPLTDAITQSTSWHNWGIDALASDPVDSNRVYAAVGMYTNDWDSNNGSIIRSADQGKTWEITELPFKVGGNMPGRGMGERLAVDPNNNNIVYFGARSGNGLWKSTDQGATFSKVDSFTNVGTYSVDANDTTGYSSDLQGLAWITFDSTSTTINNATSRIFVGVADKSTSIYVSEDAGSTWKAVAGQPTGFLPHKGKLSPSEGYLYISYSDTSGPYDGANGTLQRYSIANGTWKDISPVTADSMYFGWGGLGVDLLNPGALVVASVASYYPDGQIWRSNNSGETWSPIWEYTSYPDENYYYSYNTDKAPWINNARLPTDTKKLGWMIEALEINPFDSDHWLYGTGLTIYGGHDLTNWDTIHNVTIESLADGIEETAVQELRSVPGGSILLAAVGDDSGFTFADYASLDVAANVSWMNPEYATSPGVDYAGLSPSSIVRSGNSGSDGNLQVAISSDGGASWSPYSGAKSGQYGGKIAYSASATTILWSSSSDGVVVSKNSGTFTAVSSLPSGAVIASDKRNDTVFYGGSGSTFYLSTDSGATFTNSSAALGAIRAIAAHPEVAGDIWVSTATGIFHSSDYGSTFTQTSTTLTNTYALALGAVGSVAINSTISSNTTAPYANTTSTLGARAATSSSSSNTTSPAIYTFGDVNSTTALYKSVDLGQTWTNIQPADQGFGGVSSNVLAASFDVAGLVFVGTNGRGVFYGIP